ncbi:MAG: lycopene cyclase family protein [Actinomycetota bacterium]
MTIRADVAVAVVGDGPAGSALASALTGRGVSCALIGRDDDWGATYGTWVDAVPDTLREDSAVWTSISDPIDVAFDARAGGPPRRRTLDRAYGVFDNAQLRSVLRSGVEHVHASVTAVEGRCGDLQIRLADRLDTHDDVAARLVVDATGWPGALTGSGSSTPLAWQTALGVVLADPPEGPLGRPALMDWSTPPRPLAGGPATFLYALPVAEGWLLEETVLAARDDVAPDDLAGSLASRLEMSVEELMASALRVERVRIPMGTPAVGVSGDGIVPFGAAAGSVHPATGYSVGDSLASADRLATVIADVLTEAPGGRGIGDDSIRTIERAVWPPSRLRSRALHDYGLDVLLSLTADETRSFFSTFFELDDRRWPPYLDAGVSPLALSSTMLAMFRRAPWHLRRRMVRAGELLSTAGSVARPAPTRSRRTPRR